MMISDSSTNLHTEQPPIAGQLRRALSNVHSADTAITIRRFLHKHLDSELMHTIFVGLIILDVLLLFFQHLIDVLFLSGHCDGHEVPKAVHTIDLIFTYYSLFLITIFGFELIAKGIMYGWIYFKNIWHIFDVVLVTAGFSIDVILLAVGHEGTLAGLTTLLVLGRLFRIVRFGHGVAETVQAELQKKIMAKTKEIEELKQELKAQTG